MMRASNHASPCIQQLRNPVPSYRKRKKRLVKGNRAVDVLREKMEFYNSKANELVAGIVEVLKKSEISQGKRLHEMYKMMHSHNEIVIDCAAKLAPYQSSKLQSVELTKKEIKRYVLQVPVPAGSTQEWLNQVKQQQLPAPVLNREEPEQVVIPPSYNDDDDWEYKNLVKVG